MVIHRFCLAKIDIKITCADIVGLLNVLHNANIQLSNVKYGNDLELFITISRENYNKIMMVAKKYGASVRILRQYGLYYGISHTMNRPVLIALLFIIIIINIFLPRYVLFLTVEGNNTIPTKKILECVSECGIQFGTVRKGIRSETVKNQLLEKIPELQWAGINTSGCTAIISVKEKSQNEMLEYKHSVGNIIASCDGIIKNMTVVQGNPLCRVGQAVVAGQTLVSGYTDCGIVTKATQANAEVTALTLRNLSVISPLSSFAKEDIISTKTRYRLQIGKNLINLSKDSGILGMTCDKIYSKKYWYLPGGFQLPICFIKETVISYSLQQSNLETTQDGSWLADFSQAYLRNNMIAGEILSSNIETNTVQGGTLLKGRYVCCEMIGQFKYEQIITKDEQND